MDALISELPSLIGVVIGGLIGFLGAYLQRMWSANAAARANLARCQLHLNEIMVNRMPGNPLVGSQDYIEKIFDRLDQDLREYYVTLISCSKRQQKIQDRIYRGLRSLVFDWQQRDWFAEDTEEDYGRLDGLFKEIDTILGRKRV